MTPARPSWEEVSDLHRSVDPVVARVVHRLHRRLVAEALANVRPIRPEAPQPLFPPRRRFLGPSLAERLTRVERALEVIGETRVTDPVDGSVELTAETLCLLHGVVADRGVAEAGRLRTVPVGFEAGKPFGGAPVDELRPFVDRALRELDETRVDGWVEAAARAVARLLTIHPFSDGNGRVARLVFHLEQRRSDPAALGPGVDLWAPWRRGYLDALRASDPTGSVDRFDVGDPTPFVEWACARAADGVELWAARIETVARLHERLADELPAAASSADSFDAAVAIAVAIDRNVTLSELDDLDVVGADGVATSAESPTTSVNALVSDRLLGWDPRGLLQPTDRLLTLLGAPR